MRVLVFGAGGQVGQALAATVPGDVELTGLDRSECDIGKQEQIESALERIRPVLVINAAAYTAVDHAEDEPEAARATNGTAPGLIAAASRRVGARLVHVSTDFVFAGTRCSPLRPDDPTGPLSIYGLTKLEGEQAVLSADPNALIVRTAWVYAADGSNFVNTMLRLMTERDELAVVGDQIGTPTWAPSLSNAIWAMYAKGASGIHHYTDAGIASWYDFAVAIHEEAFATGLITRRVAVRPISSQQYLTRAPRPAFSVLDKSATWSLLGAPAPHWRENLRRCLREKGARE